MKELEEIIAQKGQVLPGDILKVDCFLNHQIDVEVMDMIGKEFARLFADIKPTKILTIETSGVAIAQATSLNMDKQLVVYAKKGFHLNMDDSSYNTTERSYTQNRDYVVRISKDYLNSNDKVLIVDDFLARGEATNSLLELCRQANAEVLGVGIVVAKMYQQGYERIKKQCPNIQILAKVKHLSEDGSIEFEWYDSYSKLS